MAIMGRKFLTQEFGTTMEKSITSSDVQSALEEIDAGIKLDIHGLIEQLKNNEEFRKIIRECLSEIDALDLMDKKIKGFDLK